MSDVLLTNIVIERQIYLCFTCSLFNDAYIVTQTCVERKDDR
jgi:hypothetical protein